MLKKCLALSILLLSTPVFAEQQDGDWWEAKSQEFKEGFVTALSSSSDIGYRLLMNNCGATETKSSNTCNRELFAGYIHKSIEFENKAHKIDQSSIAMEIDDYYKTPDHRRNSPTTAYKELMMK